MAARSCRRKLDTRSSVQQFLHDVLGVDADRHTVSNIVQAELSLPNFEMQPTLTHVDYRVDYKDPMERDQLGKQILKELITLPILEHDSEITLGYGGAKPPAPCADAQAYIVSGAPASGKSGIARNFSESHNAYILDSDFAKRKYPEYQEYFSGASLLHRESDALVFGESNSLFEYCVYEHFNIVIPLVGRTEESVRSICRKLKKYGYTIHLINVRLDRFECTRRAYQRFIQESRYVPLSYIFDEVANEPERIYYILRLEGSERNGISSFAQLSTDVPLGQSPIILDMTELSPVITWSLSEEAVSL